MFKLEIIKLNGEVEHIYNMNKLDDDFLRFIVRNYGIHPESLKAYAMPDHWRNELEAYLKLGEAYKLQVNLEGKLRVIHVTEQIDEATGAVEEVVNVIKDYDGVLIEWPYDDKGNFIKAKQAVV